ncbi:hypothetical protein [Helicobacter kayseriensis]|uniref:hypothetical protein n=1 Tax=Helicobacter kayseriensis TaxID=2905877 RepID=UPI001E57D70E|nr:hypothetical protein [Helicobacter kayseriensis]MCE3047119.1 hypothetical protein [Helicobacter kayseriensis]MCE3048490.1 hypothetical protein [Helicobacter kayseriensis]
MREAFSLLEFIFTLFILGLILGLGGKFYTQKPLILAGQSLLADLQHTQSLALQDSRFFPNLLSTTLTHSLSPSLDPHKLISPSLRSLWQIQFHTSGIYTQNSYSIYIDTPRYSATTHWDGRPMSGDFIALEPTSNQCLSGYNNTNISDYCKNNASPDVRLKEQFGVEKITLEGDSFCKEKDGGRIYFDDFGVPYCGRNPQPISKPYKITLYKGKESLKICVAPLTGRSTFCH